MKYGFFDDANREYVIERPDTPAPWVNYLGSPEYGAIISNNAGGYSFAKSGANGRILRYVFNSFDTPGTFTSGIIILKITGPPPGSRWEKIWKAIPASAPTAWATQEWKPNTAEFPPRPAIMYP